MKTFLIISSREWKSFTRNYAQLVVIAVFIGTALYAIHYGKAVIGQQQNTAKYITRQNAQEQQLLAKGISADTTTAEGLAAWEKAAYPSKVRFFLNYYAIDEPAPLAELSIGQRDVNPYYLQLNAQNLYLQVFKSEIANPRKLLAGNFDLSFVIIYLLPLLIITFTYNLLSEEQERGTLSLLRIQPVSLHRIILYKALFWWGIITALLLLISGIAFLWSNTPATAATIGWWLLITWSYTACWFALILLINAFRRSSAFNALSSLGVWLLLLIVIPSLLNLAFTNESQADPTKLTDYIRRRQGLGETTQEKKEVLQHFYKRYPQYRNNDTTVAARFFEFQAYSAYVTLADDEAKPAVDAYYRQVWDRHQQIAAFHIINPAVNTQELLNTLAHSGLENGYNFRNSVTAFHKRLCHFSFEPLFAGRFMTKADFGHIPVFMPLPAPATTRTMLKGLGWIWLLTAITAGIAYHQLKYNHSYNP